MTLKTKTTTIDQAVRAKKAETSSSDDTLSLPSAVAQQTAAILAVMNEKIMQAPALNGGFEALDAKVSAIAESQEKLGTKVEESNDKLTVKIDEIHTALYQPDNGVYARVKEHSHQISTLVEWKQKFASRMKWVLGLIAGAMLGGIAKAVVEFVTGHIKIM